MKRPPTGGQAGRRSRRERPRHPTHGHRTPAPGAPAAVDKSTRLTAHMAARERVTSLHLPPALQRGPISLRALADCGPRRVGARSTGPVRVTLRSTPPGTLLRPVAGSATVGDPPLPERLRPPPIAGDTARPRGTRCLERGHPAGIRTERQPGLAGGRDRQALPRVRSRSCRGIRPKVAIRSYSRCVSVTRTDRSVTCDPGYVKGMSALGGWSMAPKKLPPCP